MTRLPTYEYRCDSCEKNFDVVQSFHDDPLTTCPTCGSRVRKVFGNVGIVFKGSGFYKTDSRPGAAKVPAKESAGSESTGTESSGSESAGSEGSGGESAAPGPASSGDGASTTSTSDSSKSPTTPPAPKTPAKTPSKGSGS